MNSNISNNQMMAVTNEYQSIFSAYNSPPLKLRQSGILDKKLNGEFSHYMQVPQTKDNQI